MKTYVFQMEGVFCPQCVRKLEETLGPVTGVRRLTVSEDYGTLTLEADVSAPPAAALVRLIEGVPQKNFRVLQTREKEGGADAVHTG